MSLYTITNFAVCVDCCQYVAGISEHERGEAYPDAVKHNTAQHLNWTLVNGDSDDDIDFSTRPCELCGSQLAGSRHAVAALSK